MSNMADQVFGAFTEFSDAIHKLDKEREIRERIRSVTAERCGNCNHWMKTRECPRERRGEKQSCNAPGCEEFTLDSWSKKMSEEWKAELLRSAGSTVHIRRLV